LKVDDRVQSAAEREQRHVVMRIQFVEFFFRQLDCLRPQVRALHAGARVDQQRQSLARQIAKRQRGRFSQKRPAKRQHDQRQRC
jgi:hypothetical protein